MLEMTLRFALASTTGGPSEPMVAPLFEVDERSRPSLHEYQVTSKLLRTSPGPVYVGVDQVSRDVPEDSALRAHCQRVARQVAAHRRAPALAGDLEQHLFDTYCDWYERVLREGAA